MGEALLSGSAAAAFLAGVVAFFAPCCATVMLPSYLSATAGARRWQVMPLTALYIAGVATVVWPLTIGAAALSSLVNRYHVALFVVMGSFMIIIGIGTVRGWMWSAPLPSARAGGDVAGIYLMGLFGGAATACCAPVLAGAVAIAGVSAGWWAGAALGLVYLFGLVTPLIVASFGVERVRRRLRDPAVTLRLGGRTLRTTRMRIIGGVAFVALGIFMLVLAATGQTDTAPAPQLAVGRWLQDQAGWLAEHIPLAVGWVAVVAFLAAIVVAAWHSMSRTKQEESS